jgi:hypothetical protein
MKKTLICIIMLVTACQPLERFTHISADQETLTPIAIEITPVTSTATASIEKQITPDEIPPPDSAANPSSRQCYFNWAQHDLPDLTNQIEETFKDSGITIKRVSAYAYGEDCIAEDDTVVYFTTLETDFNIAIAVKDLTDEEALGSLVEQVLRVLDRFPAGETPGPQPGHIRLTFESGEKSIGLWFTVTEGQAARDKGLRGKELYSALRKP